jgi:hypothetical protein
MGTGAPTKYVDLNRYLNQPPSSCTSPISTAVPGRLISAPAWARALIFFTSPLLMALRKSELSLGLADFGGGA